MDTILGLIITIAMGLGFLALGMMGLFLLFSLVAALISAFDRE